MSDATTTIEKPEVVDTSAGGSLCHCTCTGCEEEAIAAGRPLIALCGVLLDDSDELDELPAGDLMCIVCEETLWCPTCGAYLIGGRRS